MVEFKLVCKVLGLSLYKLLIFGLIIIIVLVEWFWKRYCLCVKVIVNCCVESNLLIEIKVNLKYGI